MLFRADPQPFYGGSWSRSDKILRPTTTGTSNFTPQTTKIAGIHDDQQRRGRIGIAQEVAGLEWHDGIPLQEQEECGQSTGDQRWFKCRRRIAVVLQQLEWPHERERRRPAVIDALE